MTTTSFAVLINGGPSDFSKASRGLRQGHPLFPMLFILIMELLDGLMNRAKEKQLFKGVRVGRGNAVQDVSHLLFADDTNFWPSGCEKSSSFKVHSIMFSRCFGIEDKSPEIRTSYSGW